VVKKKKKNQRLRTSDEYDHAAVQQRVPRL
jgi:hypothetical protein